MNADEKRKKLLETIQGFRLIDDTYFNTFMEDNFEGMGLFLRIILQDPALHVTEIQTQREVSNIYGRSVRFDVFTKSADGTICNTEVQRTDAWATPERARFNSSMMDTLTVKKGFEWGKDHLPPMRVIFITEHDVLGGGASIYHSYRTIAEMGHERLADDAEIIYVNASCQDDDTALGRLMHDMFCANPSDMYYQELAERSQYFKTNRHGVMKMCKAMEDLMKEIIEESRVEEKQKIILNLIKKGMSLQFVADVTGWTIEQIQSFLHTQNLQPAQ